MLKDQTHKPLLLITDIIVNMTNTKNTKIFSFWLLNVPILTLSMLILFSHNIWFQMMLSFQNVRKSLKLIWPNLNTDENDTKFW